MKIQRAATGMTGIRVLFLAIGLAVQANPSSASMDLGTDPALQGVLAPASLGGVSLTRPQPWRPATAYRLANLSPGYAPAASDADGTLSKAKADPGVDPIQTAAIIPGVFGSVALSMRNFPVSAHWAPVYKAIVDCKAGSPCDRKNAAFGEIIDIASRKAFREKLSFINSSINRLIAYKSDMAVYGVMDHWATPSEVLEHRAGDCEDYAILKMAALLRAGIPAQSMACGASGSPSQVLPRRRVGEHRKRQFHPRQPQQSRPGRYPAARLCSALFLQHGSRLDPWVEDRRAGRRYCRRLCDDRARRRGAGSIGRFESETVAGPFRAFVEGAALRQVALSGAERAAELPGTSAVEDECHQQFRLGDGRAHGAELATIAPFAGADDEPAGDGRFAIGVEPGEDVGDVEVER
jgi:predicted transglutaminase-like cysteine proteinase